MKRLTTPFFVLLIVVGAMVSVAATTSAPSTSESTFDGKFVVIDGRGFQLSQAYESPRFEAVGQEAYIVVPMQHAGMDAAYDYWIPLTDVASLRVFDSKADADRYSEWRDR